MHYSQLKIKPFHFSIKFADLKEAFTQWASGFIGY